MVNAEIRLIIFFAAEDRETLQSSKTRLGADCGSDYQLLIAKFRLKWKHLRPFTYDLDRVPYDYTALCLVAQRVRHFETPWTVTHQAPLSMGIL